MLGGPADRVAIVWSSLVCTSGRHRANERTTSLADLWKTYDSYPFFVTWVGTALHPFYHPPPGSIRALRHLEVVEGPCQEGCSYCSELRAICRISAEQKSGLLCSAINDDGFLASVTGPLPPDRYHRLDLQQ